MERRRRRRLPPTCQAASVSQATPCALHKAWILCGSTSPECRDTGDGSSPVSTMTKVAKPAGWRVSSCSHRVTGFTLGALAGPTPGGWPPPSKRDLDFTLAGGRPRRRRLPRGPASAMTSWTAFDQPSRLLRSMSIPIRRRIDGHRDACGGAVTTRPLFPFWRPKTDQDGSQKAIILSVFTLDTHPLLPDRFRPSSRHPGGVEDRDTPRLPENVPVPRSMGFAPGHGGGIG